MIKQILNKEFWKTIVLVCLIFLSMAQICILWSYQSYGLPFHFFRNIFGYSNINNFVDIKKNREELLRPRKIILSDKFEEIYWIFNDKEIEYEELWYEAKNYLKDILNFTNLQKDIEVLPKSLWFDILCEQTVIYELETEFDKNTVRVLLNLPKSNAKIPEGISKIALVPYDESVLNANNKMCMYILDNDYLYKVTIPMKYEYKEKGWYDEVLRSCNNNEYRKKYEIAGNYFSKGYSNILNIKEDVFLYLREDSKKAIKPVNISVPDLTKLDKISNIILGKEINNYVIYSGSDDSMIFQNLDSYYKILNSGLLNYKYKQKIRKEDKGTESIALEKALDFIEKCNGIIKDSDAKLVLTGIEENNKNYKFIFSYKVDNLLVANSTNGYDDLKAIEIKSNGKKVIECNWIIRNFKIEDSKNFYSEYFMTLFDNDDFDIYDRKIINIDIVYGSLKSKSGYLKSYWNVNTFDGKYVLYDMVK